jgi:hypothetical protein
MFRSSFDRGPHEVYSNQKECGPGDEGALLCGRRLKAIDQLFYMG